MASADDYRTAIERCVERAQHSQTREDAQIWEQICESYELLLVLDKLEEQDGALIRAS